MGVINVLILFVIMFVNKWEDFKVIVNFIMCCVVFVGVCVGLLVLLVCVVVIIFWLLFGFVVVGEEVMVCIGEYLFIDYLLLFEVVFVLLLMVMIGVIVLVCCDVFVIDVVIGEVVD